MLLPRDAVRVTCVSPSVTLGRVLFQNGLGYDRTNIFLIHVAPSFWFLDPKRRYPLLRETSYRGR